MKKVEEIECYSKEEKYGFKSVMKPHAIKEMEHFENDFYGMAKNLKFRKEIKLSEFQKEMKSDLNEMNKLDKVIIAADKSRNFYTCDVPEYKNLRNQNITANTRSSK